MPMPGGKLKERRSQFIVALDATSVRIHPAKAELRLHIAVSRAIAIKADGALDIPGNPFPMFVRACFHP
ncbi:hypothetical protein AGMMS50256_14210 [Betaproteobacteria bacterium]|nr:hypothetical protein AGMMS50256_14210 [Betaproteobacteria bacterium]